MSNEYAPTDGGRTATDGDPSVSGDGRARNVDLDALFEVLADWHRRRVLDYLHDADDGVAPFSDLVEHVADEWAGESTDDERIAVSLHHDHLPKLDDANVVAYDSEREVVEYRANPVVEEWVELALSQESDRQ